MWEAGSGDVRAPPGHPAGAPPPGPDHSQAGHSKLGSPTTGFHGDFLVACPSKNGVKYTAPGASGENNLPSGHISTRQLTEASSTGSSQIILHFSVGEKVEQAMRSFFLISLWYKLVPPLRSRHQQ